MVKKNSSRRSFLAWLSSAFAAALAALTAKKAAPATNLKSAAGGPRRVLESLGRPDGDGEHLEREADFWRPLDSGDDP